MNPHARSMTSKRSCEGEIFLFWTHVIERYALKTCLLCYLFVAPADQSALSGQKTWTITGLQGQVNALAISPQDPNIAYASVATDGAIFKSTDGGGSWTRVFEGAQAGPLAVHPSNPNLVIACVYLPASGRQAIMKTADGGRTWTPIDDPSLSAQALNLSIQFHPADPNTIDIVGETAIYRSTDGGKEWTERSSPICDT